MQGVAEHVTQNSEELRAKWVKHTEGKIKLNLDRPSFIPGEPGNDWSGLVSGQPDSFTVQMEGHLAEGLDKDLYPKELCENASLTETVALQVTVMSAC